MVSDCARRPAAQQLPRCLSPAALEGVTRPQALDHCLRATAAFCFSSSYLHPLVSCSHLLGSLCCCVVACLLLFLLILRHAINLLRLGTNYSASGLAASAPLRQHPPPSILPQVCPILTSLQPSAGQCSCKQSGLLQLVHLLQPDPPQRVR